MSKTLLKHVASHVDLYRCDDTGIAWVEDGIAGCKHSCHPNIDSSGSVTGMKEMGYWQKNDRTIKSHGHIYNIDHVVVTDELDELARQHCKCGGKH